jgi:hypothetical protein
VKHGILQLSFCGPFFYDLRLGDPYNPPGKVSIYAPKCPGHKAGIFTAKNEYPIRGRFKNGNQRVFTLSGGVFAHHDVSTPPVPCDSTKLILHSTPNTPIAPQNASFRLEVPVPQYIYPLNPSPELEVVKPPDYAPTGDRHRYATGLRFYYEAHLDREITLLDGPNVVWYSDFDQVCCDEIRNSDVVVRSADPTITDPDHDDAISCFDLIAGIAGVGWWLTFENPQSPAATSGFAKGGADCLAPAVATP